MTVTYHFIIFATISRARGAVLTVGQTEAQSDVVLAVQLLVLGDTHDEVGEAELAHICGAVWCGAVVCVNSPLSDSRLTALPPGPGGIPSVRPGPTKEC